jgi:CubicO group peptidase (beta-lactamase class C family)
MGNSAKQFADERLFQPLGIKEYTWDGDKQGITFGGSGLNMRAIDLLKIGQLYLNNGSYNSIKVLSKQWVYDSTQKHNEGGSPVGQHYGYCWWVSNVFNYKTYFAYGYGGQFLYIIPDLEVAIVLTSI